MALEDAMRRGQLTRTQVAILWLIRAEGEAGTFQYGQVYDWDGLRLET